MRQVGMLVVALILTSCATLKPAPVVPAKYLLVVLDERIPWRDGLGARATGHRGFQTEQACAQAAAELRRQARGEAQIQGWAVDPDQAVTVDNLGDGLGRATRTTLRITRSGALRSTT